VRVLLVCDDYPSAFAGGVATSVMNLARGLAGLDHDVVLVWPEDPEFCPIPGVRQVKTQGRRLQIGKNHVVLALPPRAGDLPAGWRPDVVHAHQPTPLSWWARGVARRYHAPFLVTMHNLLEHTHDPLLRSFVGGVYRTILRAADVTVTPAAFATRYAIAHFGVTDAVTLSNSVDREGFGGFLEGQSPRQNELPEVLAAISLVPYKNPEMMVDLWQGLRERGVRARLSIAGKGALREPLEAKIRTLGLGDWVRFLGTVPHSELAPLMRNADAFLLTSRVELQPMVLLESKIVGTPALVADSPLSGAAELVADGVTGATFPVDDLDAAVTKLETILRDPSRLQAMREATARDAARFDLGPVALAAVALYERARETLTRRRS
jgi:glycosyltransferase involved in cell wall biosynthesis